MILYSLFYSNNLYILTDYLFFLVCIGIHEYCTFFTIFFMPRILLLMDSDMLLHFKKNFKFFNIMIYSILHAWTFPTTCNYVTLQV